MKVLFENKGKLIALLIVATQLLNTFCSRRLQTVQSTGVVDKTAGTQKLLVDPHKENTELKNVTINNTAVINSDSRAEGTLAEIRAENAWFDLFLNEGIEKEIDTKGADAEMIVETAREYFGVPHCMGGTTMKCMDCSGLLVRVFARHGIRLPHNSEDQARFGKIIGSRNDLEKGDLVFFTRSYKTRNFITHSGIYAGDNKFIHTSSGKGVTLTSMDDSWWKEKFVFGTRLFDRIR